MAADYPTSAKSFATKVDNVDLVMAADINDIQTEVAAIETQLITSKLADIASPAFTSYTPTLTSGSGTFTDAGVTGYYFQIGNVVFVKIVVSIATNGTAAASVIVTLPITQKNTFRESFCGNAIVSSSGTQKGTLQVQSYPADKVRIYKYDGAYPGEDGVALIVSGFYEVA